MKVLVRKTNDPFDDEVVEQSRWLRTMDQETGAPLSSPGGGYSQPVEVPDEYIGRLKVEDFDVETKEIKHTDDITGEDETETIITARFIEKRFKERVKNEPAEYY